MVYQIYQFLCNTNDSDIYFRSKINQTLIRKDQSNKQPARGYLKVLKYLQENFCGSVYMLCRTSKL